TGPWALPRQGRAAAAQGVPAQPPREAAVPVRVLAQPAPGTRPARRGLAHAHRRQAEDHRPQGGIAMTTETIAGVAVDRNEEGFFTDATQWTEEMAPELAKAEG